MSEIIPTPLTDKVFNELHGASIGFSFGWMRGHAEKMERQLTIAHRELNELRQWKESSLSVTPPLQEIGKALGLTLGVSIHDKILPGIQTLQQELSTSRLACEYASNEVQIRNEALDILTERLNQRVIDFNEANKSRIQRIQELEAQLSNQS